MDVQILTLCDDIHTDPTTGKLTVLGIFDQVQAKAAPVTLPKASVTAKLRFYPGETGEKNLEIKIADPQGGEIVPSLKAKINVELNPASPGGAFLISASIQQVKFPRFGMYELLAMLDGVRIGAAPLFVIQSKRGETAGLTPSDLGVTTGV